MMEVTKGQKEAAHRFELKLDCIGMQQENWASLVLLASNPRDIKVFCNRLLTVAYPSASRSVQTLHFDYGRRGMFRYQIISPVGDLEVGIPGVPDQFAELIRATLEEHGSFPLLFGHTDRELTLLKPLDCSVILTTAYFGTQPVTGHTRYDWTPFFATVEDELQIIPFQQ